MPTESPFNCLWLKEWNIYVNTSRMCKASNYWKMTHKRLYCSTALLYLFSDACCSWTSSADELFLERNASTTICSWTVCHVTALIVFHYFTSVVINILCKQQRCWKIKTFVCHLSIIRSFAHSVCVHIYMYMCIFDLLSVWITAIISAVMVCPIAFTTTLIVYFILFYWQKMAFKTMVLWNLLWSVSL